MAELQRVGWVGKSGKIYEYFVHDSSESVLPAAGNFIWAKLLPNKTWVAICIGEGERLSNVVKDGMTYPCVIQHGATHLHIHTTSPLISRYERRNERNDLVDLHQPACTQFPESF